MRLFTCSESEIWVEEPKILCSCAGTMPQQKHATMCGNFYWLVTISVLKHKIIPGMLLKCNSTCFNHSADKLSMSIYKPILHTFWLQELFHPITISNHDILQ